MTLLDLKPYHTVQTKHEKLKPAYHNTVYKTQWNIRIGIKKVHGSGRHILTLHEAACIVRDIKCCVTVWVTDW